jgi:hypothetical protein
MRMEKALERWRQGDFARVSVPFHTLHHPQESAVEGWEPSQEEEAEPFVGAMTREGVVLVSQTCDVVRGVATRNRNFLQVCALVPVSARDMEQVKRGKSPQLAYLPGAERYGMVVDLNTVAMVEKPLVASWPRESGCCSDEEVTAFAAALSRHKERYAFPDDFSDHVVKAFQDRAQKRHDSKASLASTDPAEHEAALEAAGFKALREIRVAAEPSWDRPEKVVLRLILRQRDSGLTTSQWEELRVLWEGLLHPHGQIRTAVVEHPSVLDEWSAREYLESHRLDLDYLSSGENHAVE